MDNIIEIRWKVFAIVNLRNIQNKSLLQVTGGLTRRIRARWTSIPHGKGEIFPSGLEKIKNGIFRCGNRQTKE